MPRYYNIIGIWALKAYYVGSLCSAEVAEMEDILHRLVYMHTYIYIFIDILRKLPFPLLLQPLLTTSKTSDHTTMRRGPSILILRLKVWDFASHI